MSETIRYGGHRGGKVLEMAKAAAEARKAGKRVALVAATKADEDRLSRWVDTLMRAEPPAWLVREIHDGDRVPSFGDALSTRQWRRAVVRWMVLVELADDEADELGEIVLEDGAPWPRRAAAFRASVGNALSALKRCFIHNGCRVSTEVGRDCWESSTPAELPR